MSQENVELAKRVVDAWQSKGVDGILSFLDDDIEYRPADERPMQGNKAVRRYYERWLEPWEDYSVRATEFLDAGDKLVVGMIVKGRGKGSGIEVALEFWNVFWIEETKAVRWDEYLDCAEALEAAGLSE